MDFIGTFVALVLLLNAYVRCNSQDQADQLRHTWLLSIKESKLKAEVKRENTHQLLYCRVGIGYHLQILTDGSVGGVHEPTEYCRLKVFAMKCGTVGMRGIKSRLYLCMNKDGIVRGMERFSPNCLFKEQLEENHYTTYSSVTHPGLYLALSHRGHLRKGNTVGPHQACTHFLPRKDLQNWIT